MKKIMIFLFLIVSLPVVSNEKIPEQTVAADDILVEIPENKFDEFYFNEKYSPYIRKGLYITGPLFMAVYGFATWGWDTRESFTLRPETYMGAHAADGASDKYGHLYGNFIIKRFTTFLFRATGSSSNKANLEGALLTEIITLGGEIGDGFGPNYGFDPYDILFNNIGIFLAVLLDYSPFLDRIFTIQWEYCPSREMRKKFSIGEHHDFFTDYSGQKVLLAVKLAGIPYLSNTFLRYINFDIGYYSRGYNPSKYYDTRTRSLHLGVSINMSIVSGDILPSGYLSSTMQTGFNYFHLPWDMETESVISDRPQNEFE
ncbi:MAG: DUF2279 domain-containing protein [Spirochaetes bacterium]|nr:DUF2279 domain-containing protein [Spirochaetota bacterium]